ncbi:MAG: hypothetical protein WCC06_12370 [Candidatus Aminicenantales bacterium]
MKEVTSFEGENFEIPFRIKNLGRAVWSSQGKNPDYLSYHLLDERNNVLQYDNNRYVFPRRVHPSEVIELTIKVRAPIEKGMYFLEFDIVREGISWFKDHGVKSIKVRLNVREKRWPEDDFPLNLAYGKFTRFKSRFDEFNKLQKLIRLTLDHNKVFFKGKTGPVQGFAAGSAYPQIWLRDANTILPASRYYYPAPFLRSWLEEHLSFQKNNGSLEDWIDSRGLSDKNTTETDQEASAVQAAYQVTRLSGPQWLKRNVGGESILVRLEKALLYVWTQRLDRKYGLITGAHTADWGDVDISHADQRAISTDGRTPWTCDIYDQSMFFEAAQNLGDLFKETGQEEKVRFWREKAKIIRENTDRWLWQDTQGFFRIHIHLKPLFHDFDEDNIFAMGGNVHAILSGLASEDKCRRIIECALERQKTYGLSTVSGTLLPPYPRNFFKHPMMDDPYEYQNGGQWDWFGGKLILAMFEHGFSRQAKDKLLEIARKNLANRGLFEWDSREGVARGSEFYSGSAGSMARALFEGYFGFKISKDTLFIEPRLDEENGTAHVFIPSSDFFAAYDYRFDRDHNKIILEYTSNHSSPGKIKILNPWFRPEQPSPERPPFLEVKRDGIPIAYSFLRHNHDALIEIETDFKKHTLEITLLK